MSKSTRQEELNDFKWCAIPALETTCQYLQLDANKLKFDAIMQNANKILQSVKRVNEKCSRVITTETQYIKTNPPQNDEGVKMMIIASFRSHTSTILHTMLLTHSSMHSLSQFIQNLFISLRLLFFFATIINKI